MKFLAVDTSGAYLTVAAGQKETFIAGYSQKKERAHAQALFPAIQRVLTRGNISLKDIGFLAVNTGPGSFAGIRIGVAAVKGLASALGCPVLSFSGLDLLAFENRTPEGKVCAVRDARRGNVYAGIYEIRAEVPRKIGRLMLTTPEELIKMLPKGCLLTGDPILFSEKEDSILRQKKIRTVCPERLLPRARTLADFVSARDARLKPANRINAVYLYEDTCTVTKAK